MVTYLTIHFKSQRILNMLSIRNSIRQWVAQWCTNNRLYTLLKRWEYPIEEYIWHGCDSTGRQPRSWLSNVQGSRETGSRWSTGHWKPWYSEAKKAGPFLFCSMSGKYNNSGLWLHESIARCWDNGNQRLPLPRGKRVPQNPPPWEAADHYLSGPRPWEHEDQTRVQEAPRRWPPTSRSPLSEKRKPHSCSPGRCS